MNFLSSIPPTGARAFDSFLDDIERKKKTHASRAHGIRRIAGNIPDSM